MIRRKIQKVGFEGALNECVFSQQFFERLKSGRYIFVDSCFCLNRPEYIQWNQNGVAELTTYARTHLAECCLSFVSVIMFCRMPGIHGALPSIFDMVPIPIVSDPHYIEDAESEKARIKRHIDSFKTMEDEILEIVKKLPLDFPGTLDTLIILTSKKYFRYQAACFAE